MNKRRLMLLVLAYIIAAWTVSCAICPAISGAQGSGVEAPTLSSEDISSLSLESLMDIKVTSVSRKSERIFDTASAVYALTQEDIRRSGLTSVPELLRMVPGLQVCHIDGNKWAISTRGFVERFAKMMLVLIDGRSVYTPLFSGVYWDAQDVPMEDIDRIEVIRGPGAAVWGANAVNGVINIITKRATDTGGGLVSVIQGGQENSQLLRFSGDCGNDGRYRVYVKNFRQDGFMDTSGDEAFDDWDQRRGGFRVDRALSNGASLMMQGDIYGGDQNQTLTLPLLSPPYVETVEDTAHISGGNVLVSWNRIGTNGSDTTLQAYYDRTQRREQFMEVSLNTLDLEFRRQVGRRGRHDVMWGLGYRNVRDDLQDTYWVTWDPSAHTSGLASGFVQDEISLGKGHTRLTIGSKLEHSDLSGFNVQPSVRLARTSNNRRAAWAAISRAVRTPSRADMNSDTLAMVIPPSPPFSPLPIAVKAIGNPDMESEEALAYELGYRVQRGSRFSVDAATFYNVYDNARDVVPGTPYLDPVTMQHIIVPLRISNGVEGNSYGAELSANWMVTDSWRLALAGSRSISHLSKLDIDPITGQPYRRRYRSQWPESIWSIRSRWDAGDNLEFDASLYYVDGFTPPDTIAEYPADPARIPGSLRLDLRLAWQPNPSLEVSLVGQNLLDDRRKETGPAVYEMATEVPRSFYGKVAWKF